jgi:hypothetical protein
VLELKNEELNINLTYVQKCVIDCGRYLPIDLEAAMLGGVKDHKHKARLTPDGGSLTMIEALAVKIWD